MVQPGHLPRTNSSSSERKIQLAHVQQWTLVLTRPSNSKRKILKCSGAHDSTSTSNRVAATFYSLHFQQPLRPSPAEEVLLKSVWVCYPLRGHYFRIHLEERLRIFRLLFWEKWKEKLREKKRTRKRKQQAEGMKCWIIVPWFFCVHNSTENAFS